MAADIIYEIVVKDNLQTVEKKANSFFSATSKGIDGLQSKLNQRLGLGSDMLNFFTNSQNLLGGVIGKAGVFSDKIADIQKTTGQSKEEVEGLASAFGRLDTRTSLNNLLDIAKIGGAIGVGKEEMQGFVKVMDMASVALGDEFGGGVEEISKNLGTLKNLFSETKSLKYDEAMSKIGSSINHLGSVGTATGGNIADFTKRMGALGSLGPTLTQTLGIGATLEELGINSEIASGGLTNLFLTAGKEADKFALQLGMTTKQFQDLLSQNPNELVFRLSNSLKGLNDAQLIQVLDGLKISSQESIKVFQSLSSNTGLLVERQKQAADSFRENTSLSAEFAIKNNTLQASIEKTEKRFAEYGLYLGSTFASIAPLITATGALGQSYAMLSPVVGGAGRSLLAFAGHPATLLTAAIGGIGYALLRGSGILKEYERDINKVAKGFLDLDFGYVSEGLRGIAHQMGILKDNSTIRLKIDLEKPDNLQNAIGGELAKGLSANKGIKLPYNIDIFSEDTRKKLVPLLRGDKEEFLRSLPAEQSERLRVSDKVGQDWFSTYRASDSQEILLRFLQDELYSISQKNTNRLDDITNSIYKDEGFVSGLIAQGFGIEDKYSFLKYQRSLSERLGSKEDGVLYPAVVELNKLDSLFKDYQMGRKSNVSSPFLSQDLNKEKRSSMDIIGGGSRPTTINVSIGKFQDSVNFYSSDVGGGIEKSAIDFNNTWLRILNGSVLNYR